MSTNTDLKKLLRDMTTVFVMAGAFSENELPDPQSITLHLRINTRFHNFFLRGYFNHHCVSVVKELKKDNLFYLYKTVVLTEHEFSFFDDPDDPIYFLYSHINKRKNSNAFSFILRSEKTEEGYLKGDISPNIYQELIKELKNESKN